ncbi:hypothetical protein Tco_0633011, partial [Tanacetum coccineum]
MSNTSMEDLLAQIQAMFKKHRSRIKEIIDAGIARIDSIMSNKAEEETSKESGSKKEKNKQPKVRPTRVQPKPQRHNRMVKVAGFWKKFLSQQVKPEKVLVVCWEKFVATLGTNRTHKLALASDLQEGCNTPKNQDNAAE